MVDLNRIRAHLSSVGTSAEESVPPQQRPHAQRDAAAEGQLKTLERDLEHERTRREEVEARLAPLIHLCYEVRAELDQAEADRDQARAETEKAQDELREIRTRLESELASGGGKRGERKGAKQRGAKRIAELEGELETERELREDLELALKLLEKHQADDRLIVQDADVTAFEPLIASNGAHATDEALAEVVAEELPDLEPAEADAEPESETAWEADSPEQAPAEVAAEELADLEPVEADPEPVSETAWEADAPEQVPVEVAAEPLPDLEPAEADAPDQAPAGVAAEQLPDEPMQADFEADAERSWEPPADGWGVPMEAFPMTEPESKDDGSGSAGADRNARHGRSRRRLRRAGR